MFMNIFCTHLITESQGEFIKLILVLAGELDFLENANDFAQTLINLQQGPACKRKMKGHFLSFIPFLLEGWKCYLSVLLVLGTDFRACGTTSKRQCRLERQL